MTEASSPTPAAPRKRRIGFWIGTGLGSLLVLIIVAYLVATSSAFLKSFVLPKASAALKSKVTADTISVSPLGGSLSVRGLAVQPEGAEPLVSAQEVSAKFSLFGILGGKYEISDVTLVSPVVNLVVAGEGKPSNLDTFLSGMSSPGAAPASTTPFQITLNQITLKQGTVRYVKTSPGQRDEAEISGLNLTVDKFQNLQPGKLAVDATFKYSLNPASNTPSLLQGKLSGAYTYALGDDLVPLTLAGSTKVEITQAQGAWAEAAQLAATLECALSVKSIDKLNLRFEKAGATLGQLNISGPYERARNEGRLKLELLSINRQVLNLAGAAAGLDFAQTVLDGTNMLDFSKGGTVMSLNGQWAGRQLSLAAGKQTTPTVDLNLSYQVNLDFKAQSVLVQQLNLAGSQAGRELLAARLDRPMNFNWGNAQSGFKEASFALNLTNLNLTEWAVIIGTNVPGGMLSLSSLVTAKSDGKDLTADFKAAIRDFSLPVGTNRIAFTTLRAQAKAALEGYRKLTMDNYSVEALDKSTIVFSANGAMDGQLDTGNYNLRMASDANLANLLSQYPISQILCREGQAKVNLLLTQKSPPLDRGLSGSIAISGFTGTCAGYSLTNYTAQLELSGDLKGDVFQLSNLKFTAKDSYHAGGSLGLAGTYDQAKKTAQFTFNSIDFNQYAVGPFLSKALAPLEVSRFSLTSEGSFAYDPAGKSAIKANLKVGQLTLVDPSRKLPSSPLDFELALDATMPDTNSINLSQGLLKLGPELNGVRTGGAVALAGSMDLKASSAKFSYGLTNVNEKGLAAWVEPSLAPKKLQSVNIDGSGVLEYAPDKDSQITANLSVTNLVASEPSASANSSPLEAQLKLDAVIKAKVLELRQFLLALKPTSLANNQFQATGKVDMSVSNVYSGQIVAQSEALDLTPYWRLLGSANPANTTATPASTGKTAAAPQAVAATTRTEPAATTLPFRNFTAELKVGRLYLEDLAMTNLQAAVKLDGGNVRVDPLSVTLNGALIKGTTALNLGVPGYTYDVSLQTTNLPVEPLANTFMAAGGKYQGVIALNTQLKGAGITDANIKSNLAGQLNFTLTNANIVVVSSWYKNVLTPVLMVLRLSDLLNTPVNGLVANAKVGQGTATIDDFTAYTSKFQVSSKGTIPLAVPLTNSPLSLPIDIALERSLAKKANLIPSDAPTNTAFVSLPNFVQVKGTLGNYQVDRNDLAIAGMTAKSIVGLPQFVGTKAGSVLTNIAGVFGGGNTANDKLQDATNSPAGTSTNKILKLLDLLPGGR